MLLQLVRGADVFKLINYCNGDYSNFYYNNLFLKIRDLKSTKKAFEINQKPFVLSIENISQN
jgi:hypothetical protein